MTTTTLSLIIEGVIGLAVIAAGVILVALHDIDGQTAIAVIGAGVLASKGATSSALALKVPAAGQTVTPAPPTVVQTPQA